MFLHMSVIHFAHEGRAWQGGEETEAGGPGMHSCWRNVDYIPYIYLKYICI